MKFLVPHFNTGLLYEAGPFVLILFFVVMLLRVTSSSRTALYKELERAPLEDDEL